MIGTVILVVAAVASWLTWRDSVRRAADRRVLLAAASGLLTEVHETPLASGYVRVTGTYRGHPALLEPVADTLAVRKLPTLWLMVTVPAPVAVGGTYGLMMRENGSEVFSRYRDLPHAVAVPATFPEWAGVRTDAPHDLPHAEIVARHLQRFHDDSGKELLITPKGLRMVVLLAQADGGKYLIFRDARFDAAQVPADLLRGILDDLHALRDDLAAGRSDSETTRLTSSGAETTS